MNIHEKLLCFVKPINVEIIYFEKEYSNDKLFPYISKKYVFINADYLFHGFFDNYRNDNYNSVFQSII